MPWWIASDERLSVRRKGIAWRPARQPTSDLELLNGVLRRKNGSHRAAVSITGRRQKEPAADITANNSDRAHPPRCESMQHGRSPRRDSNSLAGGVLRFDAANHPPTRNRRVRLATRPQSTFLPSSPAHGCVASVATLIADGRFGVGTRTGASAVNARVRRAVGLVGGVVDASGLGERRLRLSEGPAAPWASVVQR